MFQNLEVFQISQAMAQHAGRSQAMISQNVANADTPGYVPMRLPDFKASYAPDASDLQKATRPEHLHGAVDAGSVRPVELRDHASPDGNAVSVEREMLASVDAVRQHDRALQIYKSALTVLHATLGRR
ncbi:MAG: FlgB family protein [Pseudomonadota bacterium]